MSIAPSFRLDRITPGPTLNFSLSTRWNATRHTAGEAIVEEILDIGLDRIELGYNLNASLIPGIKKMIDNKTVHATSVHNYCPIPANAIEGHPELHTLASSDYRERQAAVHHTTQTIRFAKELEAKIVVIHCGNVEMRNLTGKLIDLSHQGKRISNAYEKIKLKLILKREKKVPRQLDHLCHGLGQLMPVLQETGIRLGLENLPTWEAIPTETEYLRLIQEFGSEHLCYWHDIGHAQIRENLGFIHHLNTLEKLSGTLGGMHIHDVKPIAQDHLMPPMGMIDFSSFKKFAEKDIPRVLEPSPRTTSAEIRRGLDVLRSSWF